MRRCDAFSPLQKQEFATQAKILLILVWAIDTNISHRPTCSLCFWAFTSLFELFTSCQRFWIATTWIVQSFSAYSLFNLSITHTVIASQSSRNPWAFECAVLEGSSRGLQLYGRNWSNWPLDPRTSFHFAKLLSWNEPRRRTVLHIFSGPYTISLIQTLWARLFSTLSNYEHCKIWNETAKRWNLSSPWLMIVKNHSPPWNYPQFCAFAYIQPPILRDDYSRTRTLRRSIEMLQFWLRLHWPKLNRLWDNAKPPTPR
jgi:hypothetical protein